MLIVLNTKMIVSKNTFVSQHIGFAFELIGGKKSNMSLICTKEKPTEEQVADISGTGQFTDEVKIKLRNIAKV